MYIFGQIMKCKPQVKTILLKIKEAFGGFEFGLTGKCFPCPEMGHKHKVKVIYSQHYHIILAASLDKMYSL